MTKNKKPDLSNMIHYWGEGDKVELEFKSHYYAKKFMDWLEEDQKGKQRTQVSVFVRPRFRQNPRGSKKKYSRVKGYWRPITLKKKQHKKVEK